MKSFLIHGLYDLKTLETLESLGIKRFAFDLRARSANLIPYHHLIPILKRLQSEKAFLVFENDSETTVRSFLNLLKEQSQKFTLIFRDQQLPRFYHDLEHSFFWTFHPEGDWRTILCLDNITGVLLPLKWQNSYQENPEMWDIIEARNLEVYIHAESFEEAKVFQDQEGIKLSIELSPEVESGFRKIDQDKLKRMKIWRRLYEGPTC